MRKPKYRTFEELEAILGKDWNKLESEVVGPFANFNREWPCGCRWAEASGSVPMGSRTRMEWLFPCAEHAAFGFHAQFDDEVWRERSAYRDKTGNRKGKLVTAEMLPTLTPGQVLRIRPNNCTFHGNATRADRLAGAWVYFVVEPKFGPGPQIESDSAGPVSTIGQITPAMLEQNEVLLVSRGEETWPKGPVWVQKKLEPVKAKDE